MMLDLVKYRADQQFEMNKAEQQHLWKMDEIEKQAELRGNTENVRRGMSLGKASGGALFSPYQKKGINFMEQGYFTDTSRGGRTPPSGGKSDKPPLTNATILTNARMALNRQIKDLEEKQAELESVGVEDDETIGKGGFGKSRFSTIWTQIERKLKVAYARRNLIESNPEEFITQFRNKQTRDKVRTHLKNMLGGTPTEDDIDIFLSKNPNFK